MEILFLMGAQSGPKCAENQPIYLTEINGKLILERQIEQCAYLQPDRFVFCVSNQDIKQFRIDAIIEQLVESPLIIRVNGSTKGAICTALLATEFINSDEELLLLSVNDFIDISSSEILDDFRNRQCDAGVVAFNSVHPRYSFAKQDSWQNVTEVAEKVPISKNALASFYYFRKGSEFVACAMNVIRKDNPINDAFYISQALNEMVLLQKKVGLFKIPKESFHPIKTEMQLAEYVMELREQKESK